MEQRGLSTNSEFVRVCYTTIVHPQQQLLLRRMKDEVTNVLRLANLVRENVRAKQLFTLYNPILITLSGGQDSICSLLLLYLFQNQLELFGASANRPPARSPMASNRSAEDEFYARAKSAACTATLCSAADFDVEGSSRNTAVSGPVPLRVALATLRTAAPRVRY